MSGPLEELIARAELRVGMSLRGKYRLERLLGVGSTGSVYLGVHRNGSESAIKVLHPELTTTPEVRARFVREGYIANRVGHPGVVRVLDDDTHTDGSVFLVMELLDGTTLERRRQLEHLEPQFVGSVVDKVLDILDAAHAAGVVHRDVKPDNVFLTTSGQVKLLDFGIARVIDASVATRGGIVLGTPDFLAPEQATGSSEDVDARADVYSVGAMLFLLLLGQTIHQGRTVPERIALAATKPARKVHEVDPTFDGMLAEVIDTALAFDKNRRYPSVRELQSALREALLSDDDTLAVGPAARAVAAFDPTALDRDPEASIAIPLAKPIRRP